MRDFRYDLYSSNYGFKKGWKSWGVTYTLANMEYVCFFVVVKYFSCRTFLRNDHFKYIKMQMQ